MTSQVSANLQKSLVKKELYGILKNDGEGNSLCMKLIYIVLPYYKDELLIANIILKWHLL